jgi:hypothetical protein
MTLLELPKGSRLILAAAGDPGSAAAYLVRATPESLELVTVGEVRLELITPPEADPEANVPPQKAGAEGP